MTHRDSQSVAAKNGSSHSTSRSLLVRLKADDPDAWQRLVTLYAPFVYHWCRKFGLPERDAADVFQEVVQSVAMNIVKFRRDRPGDTFRGWLLRITRNKVSDHFRRQADEPTAAGGTAAFRRLSEIPASGPLDEASDDVVEDSAYQQLFRRALDLIREDFTQRTWQAFWRVTVDGCSPNEVANELSMTPGAIRVAKSRVLHRLREELGDLID